MLLVVRLRVANQNSNEACPSVRLGDGGRLARSCTVACVFYRLRQRRYSYTDSSISQLAAESLCLGDLCMRHFPL